MSFFYEWEHRTGTLRPFSILHPLRKGIESQCQMTEKKLLKYLKSGIVMYIRRRKKIKRKSCHLVPKVVVDLPFEGRKVEGSWKNRRWKRVPLAGGRGEETITEPINSCIGEFPHNNCWQMMPDVWNVAEPLEMEYRQPVHQSSDQSSCNRKEIEK